MSGPARHGCLSGRHRDFGDAAEEVGPGRRFALLGASPWASLAPLLSGRPSPCVREPRNHRASPLLMGDCTGIGPEIVARALRDGRIDSVARLVVVGDARVLDLGMRDAGVTVPWRRVESVAEIDWSDPSVPLIDLGNTDPTALPRGEVSPASGKVTGDTLAHAIAMARKGDVDGITFAPLNKAAMVQGGWRYPDEHKMFAALLEHRGYFSEMNVLDGQWMSRVTSHVSLREALDLITPESIRDAIVLVDRTMRRAGIAKPRIAVAALNPHAGENGLFGRERSSSSVRPSRESPPRRVSTVAARSRPIPSTSRPSRASSTAWSRCTTTRDRSRPSSKASTAA